MKLGIIAPPEEESFRMAQRKGLDFLEFCINKGHDTGEFFGDLEKLKSWKERYKVDIGSIGRWKVEPIDGVGRIDEEELRLSYGLIDAAEELGCPNYVCGCNYAEGLSYYENCTAAIAYLSKLLDYGRDKKVRISTYNCRKGNFIHNPVAWTLIHGHLRELGIKYDPAHSRYEGADYLKELADWGERVNHVHIKGSFILNGKRVDDPPAGMDQTNWPELMTILYMKNYTGGLSLEPHSDIWRGELEGKGVDFSIQYMRRLML